MYESLNSRDSCLSVISCVKAAGISPDALASIALSLVAEGGEDPAKRGLELVVMSSLMLHQTFRLIETAHASLFDALRKMDLDAGLIDVLEKTMEMIHEDAVLQTLAAKMVDLGEAT